MGAFFQQRLEKPALVALAAVEGVGSSGVDKGLASRRSTVDDKACTTHNQVYTIIPMV